MITLCDISKEQIEKLLAIKGSNRADINSKIAKILNVEIVNIIHPDGNNSYNRVKGINPTISKCEDGYYLKNFHIAEKLENDKPVNWTIVGKNKKNEIVYKSAF